MLEKYPREVKLVYKNFPLANHRFAKKAASAALAAHKQGKFWEFHAKLFESYRAINDAKIRDIARELGLNMERFSVDMESPAIRNLIARDVDNGHKIGVRGIPKIFVNGKILKSRSLQDFQQMIAAELEKMRK